VSDQSPASRSGRRDAAKLIGAIEALLQATASRLPTTLQERKPAPSVPERTAISTKRSDDAVPPIDLDSLLERCMKSVAIVNEVFDEFESQSVRDIEQLRQSVRDGDTTACARIAHALKGAAGVLSARALAQIASQLEQMGRAGELRDAGECIERLRSEAQRCVEYIPKAKAELSDRKLK